VSPKTLRLIGIIFLVAAALLAVLNLKRVADLGMTWVSPPLLIIGMVFIILARRRKISRTI
jgi:hypothetical protein